MAKEKTEQKRQTQIQALAADAGIPPEYLEILRQGFKNNDFTVSIPLPVKEPKKKQKKYVTDIRNPAEAAAEMKRSNDHAAPFAAPVMDAERKAAVGEYYTQLFESLQDSLPELGKELSKPVSPEFAQRIMEDPRLAKQFEDMKKQILQLMRRLLSTVGFTRFYGNFSTDHPAMLLMDADASFISEKGVEILQDPETVNEAIDFFRSLCAPLLECGANAYCRNRGKQMDELQSEDWQKIFEKVVSVVNETLLGAVMHGQQFPALVMEARSMPAQEDFKGKRNRDAINFYEKWNHVSTRVGIILSLEDLTEEPAFDGDPFFQTVRNDFCDRLSDTDASIFHMREDGYTVKEIAAALRFKSHSTVSKHLKNIRNEWSAFVSENEPA